MGVVAPVKNSNTLDFGEIWTIYINLPKINNRSYQNNVASNVGACYIILITSIVYLGQIYISVSYTHLTLPTKA